MRNRVLNFYYACMVCHLFFRILYFSCVFFFPNYNLYSAAATVPTELFFVSKGIMCYQWSLTTAKIFGERKSRNFIPITSQDTTQLIQMTRKTGIKSNRWLWYLLLGIFCLLYVAMSVTLVPPILDRPDLYWEIYLYYDIVVSFGLLVLHVINGREFVKKAEAYTLMYTRPKNVGILLYIVAFFLLIRCAYIILYLVYPVHVEPWAVYILGYYLIFELVPTYLVY